MRQGTERVPYETIKIEHYEGGFAEHRRAKGCSLFQADLSFASVLATICFHRVCASITNA